MNAKYTANFEPCEFRVFSFDQNDHCKRICKRNPLKKGKILVTDCFLLHHGHNIESFCIVCPSRKPKLGENKYVHAVIYAREVISIVILICNKEVISLTIPAGFVNNELVNI